MPYTLEGLDWGLRLWDWQDEKPVQRILSPFSKKARKAWQGLGWFYPRLMTADGKRFLSCGGHKGLLLLDLEKPNPPADWEPDEEPKGKKRKGKNP